MADTPEIKITIDKEALTAEVREAVEAPMVEMAWRLRGVADSLDGGEWLREHQRIMQEQYERGRRDALSADSGEAGR